MHLFPRQGKGEVSSQWSSVPALKTGQLAPTLWSQERAAVSRQQSPHCGVAGLQSACKCTVFVLRSCNLSSLPIDISMTCGECSRSHLMWFPHSILIYYLLFTVLSPVTTMEFPSPLIWSISILPIYFQFPFSWLETSQWLCLVYFLVCVSVLRQQVLSGTLSILTV